MGFPGGTGVMSWGSSTGGQGMSEREAAELLADVRAGDRGAAQLLVESTYRQVYASLHRLCGGDGDFVIYRVAIDSLVCRKEPRNLEDEPAVFLVVSGRRYNDQLWHGMHLLRAGFRQGLGGDPHRQHRSDSRNRQRHQKRPNQQHAEQRAAHDQPGQAAPDAVRVVSLLE